MRGWPANLNFEMMTVADIHELKEFLDHKSDLYNRPEFIEDDPVSIPHLFTSREDREIAGLLAAVISWGNRKAILRSARRMMELMGHSPFAFIMESKPREQEKLKGFVHRTFNGADLVFFIRSLQKLYRQYPSLEDIFLSHATADSLQPAIHAFKRIFLQNNYSVHAAKHISDPLRGSAAKRLNMFLRWMIRRDKRGVDLGIWTRIPASILSCPLDIHSGNVARKLGLLQRKANDAKAVEELDAVLRSFDPGDPVKYDFALFGLGIFEKFASAD